MSKFTEKKTYEDQKRIFFYISVFLLVVCVNPLLIISHYNYMSVDDYAFVNYSIDSWRQYHSIFRVLKDQFVFAYNFYFSWQGTFSMTWLGGALTTMICESTYFLTTYIVLGGFVISELLLFAFIGTKILDADKYATGIISCWLLVLQILMVPNPVEAFFWANGSFMYIGSYILALFLFLLLFTYVRQGALNDDMKKRLVIVRTGIVILSILVAFGNYVTALFCLSSFIIILFFMYGTRRKGRLFVTADFVLFLFVFVINVIAPGNKCRQVVVGDPQYGPVKAVLKSIFSAGKYVVCNIYPTVIIIMIMMIPFIIDMVKNRAFEKGNTFRFPVVFTGISFGLYASQFVPTTYALGEIVAGRVLNIYRITLYLFLFANLIYWTGWILQRLQSEHKVITEEVLTFKKSYLLLTMIVFFAMFCFSAYYYGGKTLTTVSAIESLRTGQASLYKAEQEERLRILHDDSVRDVYLNEFTDPPYLLYFGDFSSDSNNQDVAKFYGKDSVRLRLWK